MSDDSIAARVYRGSSIEAWHSASVAVVDERGVLTHAFGDPQQRIALRSATKPFQALPLVTSGAADAFGLDDGQYLPHITIGWFERADVADLLRARLASMRAEMNGVETLVRRIDLARWWFTGIDEGAAPELDVVRSYAMRG